MYSKLPSLSLKGISVEFFDQEGTYLLIASISSLLMSYAVDVAATNPAGSIVDVAAIPNNLCNPLFLKGLTSFPLIVTL